MPGDTGKTYWKGKRITNGLHGRVVLVGNVIQGKVRVGLKFMTVLNFV